MSKKDFKKNDKVIEDVEGSLTCRCPIKGKVVEVMPEDILISCDDGTETWFSKQDFRIITPLEKLL